MVRFSKVTVVPVILNTRLVPLPLMVRLLSALASMVSLWLSSSCPLVSLIVAPARLELNWIVSAPEVALRMAWRREPAPLSLVFRTVKVLSNVRSSSISSRGR